MRETSFTLRAKQAWLKRSSVTCDPDEIRYTIFFLVIFWPIMGDISPIYGFLIHVWIRTVGTERAAPLPALWPPIFILSHPICLGSRRIQ